MPSWAEESNLPLGNYFKEEGVDEILYREHKSGKVWHNKRGLVMPVGTKPEVLRDKLGGGAEADSTSSEDSGTLKDRLLSKKLSEADSKKSLDK